MSPAGMVRVYTTLNQFEAKLTAAHLGAEGVLWELRGAVDSPYPLGPVHVYVDARDEALARQVLALAAEAPVAAGRAERPEPEPAELAASELEAPDTLPVRRRGRTALALLGVALVVVVCLGRLLTG